VNKAMELSEVQKHLETEMVQTKAMTPEEITGYMQSQLKLWTPTASRIAAQN
jgi:tripartite-type tricarboxylate transporter receptor subunit TctC